MCTVGDIILVNQFKNNGENIGQHSFVVLNTDKGQIGGLDYNLMCNMMSSFKSEKHRKRKLSFDENFPVTHSDVTVKNGNNREGYIKADQLYYFDKKKIDYVVIGKMNPDTFRKVIELIKKLENIKLIVDNLEGT